MAYSLISVTPTLIIFVMVVTALLIQHVAASNKTDRQLMSFCTWPEPYSLDKIQPEFLVYSDYGTKYHSFHISHEHEIRPQVKILEDDGLLNKHVVFVIHGYLEKDKSNYVSPIKDALIDKHNFTVIQVGWEHGADVASYAQGASNTQMIGKAIAKMARDIQYDTDLFKGNKSLLYLHCIGLSLGAQICGQAGNIEKGLFDRITGLDPASPGFEDCESKPRLHRNSADCVDVIHTNAFGVLEHFGFEEPLGFVDFYPNGGHKQPGCYRSLCHHVSAAVYYAYTIRGDPSFCKAKGQCENHKDLPGSCPPHIPANAQVMGYYSDCHPKVKKEARRHGVFYVDVKGEKDYYC